MAAANYVPEELIEDIFSRLPAKSLVRFKTASKKWYSLLSQDYKFAKLHLKRSKKHRLVFFRSHGETSFQSLNMDTLASREFIIPVEIEVELVGSANGLVCVAPYSERCCFLWNPSTGEYKKIFVPVKKRLNTSEGVWDRVLGFGYDSCSDDYKIVASYYNRFRIFSLKTNSWKTIKSAYLMIDQAFHCNGALHWCLNLKIVAFDLAKEVFSDIELPDEMKVVGGWRGWYDVSMWEHRGVLCVSRIKDIWMLLKYGDGKSWVKLSTSIVGRDKRPLGVSTLGEVVYRARGGSGFVKSDIQGRLSNDDESKLYNSVSRCSYIESLISPKCFDALHSQSKKTIRRPRKQRKTATT